MAAASDTRRPFRVMHNLAVMRSGYHGARVGAQAGQRFIDALKLLYKLLTSPRRSLRSDMRAVFIAASLALLVACKEQAPAANTQAVEDADAWLTRELGWVEGADPAARAAEDRVRNRPHFLSVCSLGCAVVGVSEVTARMCYPDVPVIVVDKTTEAVQSERHAALKKQARAFAETYNQRMAEQLRADGIGDCPPVDWDTTHTDITALLDKAYTKGFRGDVSLIPDRKVFQIRLPPGVSVASTQAPLCEIIGRNGLKGRAAVEVKSVDVQDDYAALVC